MPHAKHKKIFTFSQLVMPLLLALVVLCACYSIGLFDKFVIKNVTDKNYEIGDISYTGEMLDGKFNGKGTIKSITNQEEYSGYFKDGKFNGSFTFVDKAQTAHGNFLNNAMISCEFNE